MDSVTGVGVIDKSVTVLNAVADEPRTLHGLQQTTGLPRATVHRLASALVAHGLLRRDGQLYDLGSALVALGRIGDERFPLASVAAPALETLASETGESVQLFVAEGAQRRCVRSVPSPHALQWVVPEGARYPIEHGSAGRVLAGEIGVNGWVATIAEREAGVGSVSAPVLGGDHQIVGAVSVSGPIDRIGSNPGERYGDAVVAAAERVSAALAERHRRTERG